VVGVIDPDAARGAALARRFGATHANDLTALRSQQPTVAHLCTPATSHAALAAQAFDLGLNVVCEKPLAPDAATVRAMLDAARRAGRSLLPVHQYTAQPGVRTALAQRSNAGALRRAAFEFHSAGAQRIGDDAGDALIAEVLPHPLSVLAMLQPARPLAGVAWSVVSPLPGECEIIGAWGKTMVSIAVSAHARPTCARALLAFDQATLDIDFFHGFATVARGQASRGDKLLRPFVDSVARLAAATANVARRAMAWEPAYPGLRALLADFYVSLDDGPRVAGSGDAHVLDIYEARDRIAAALVLAQARRA
jgi:predicted dehydrogenase